MGQLTNVILFLFALNFVFWLASSTLSPVDQVPTFLWQGLFGNVVLSFGSLVGAAVFAGIMASAITIIGLATSSFAVIYTVPVALVTFILAYLSAPIGILTKIAGILPVEIGVFLAGFIFLIMVLGAISFIRGGEM